MNSPQPKCVVLSCIGGSQGELGVVRTLGRAGIEVVLISEDPQTIARHSRYVKEFHCTPQRFDRRRETLQFLIDYAARQPTRPVLFPTADPDLMLISELREALEPHYRLFISEREIIDQLVDKAKFFAYASRHGFAVPATVVPERLADLERLDEQLSFPVIMKPVIPQSWGQVQIAKIVDGKKALKFETRSALIDSYRRVAEHDGRVVIQAYIPGRDDHLYSLHIYMNRDGEPLAWFTGRKIRTWPTYAGIGCFVESRHVPEIIEAGVRMLKAIRYTGLALMQFKHDPRDGIFKLIEINPRASSWNLLAYACGINLPAIAWRDTAGLPVTPPGRQAEGVKYVHLEHDLKAFLDYRRHGEWHWASWLASLRGPKVFQYFAADDMKVFFVQLGRQLGGLARKLGRWRPLGGRAAKQQAAAGRRAGQRG